MCFSLPWIEQLLIWLIVVCGVIAILKIFLPRLAGIIGGDVVAIVNIVIWVVVACFVVYFCFALLECVSVSGLPLFPHR